MSRRTHDAATVEQRERDAIAGEDVGAPDPEWHETDTGNAKRFVAQFGDRLRYVEPLGGWLRHDRRRYVPDDSGEVYRLIDHIAADIWAELATVPPSHRKAWAKFA